MNKTVFSQLDTRWSKLPYPNKTYTIGNSGCGCVSVTHLLIETDKYAKYTPKNVQPYMKQFATYGNGTTWAGITKSLEHFGFTARTHAKMSQAFATLDKANDKRITKVKTTKGTKGFGRNTIASAVGSKDLPIFIKFFNARDILAKKINRQLLEQNLILWERENIY